MNLAKLSANGQITVPAEVRRRLHLEAGDKVLFVEGPNGEVVLAKAGLTALARVQAAFAGAADEGGLKDDDDVQALVDEMRGRSSLSSRPGARQHRRIHSSGPSGSE